MVPLGAGLVGSALYDPGLLINICGPGLGAMAPQCPNGHGKTFAQGPQTILSVVVLPWKAWWPDTGDKSGRIL